MFFNLFIYPGIISDCSYSHSTPSGSEKQHHFGGCFQLNEKHVNCLHFHSCLTLAQTNTGNTLASISQDMPGHIGKSPSSSLCAILLSLALLHLWITPVSLPYMLEKEGLRSPNHKEKGVIYTVLHITPEFYQKNET